MRRLRLLFFPKIRLISGRAGPPRQLGISEPRQYGGICDVVAVQMQNWKDGSIPARINEFIRMPTRRKWPRLALAVSYNTAGQQVWIVEYCAVSVNQRVSQF